MNLCSLRKARTRRLLAGVSLWLEIQQQAGEAELSPHKLLFKVKHRRPVGSPNPARSSVYASGVT